VEETSNDTKAGFVIIGYIGLLFIACLIFLCRKVELDTRNEEDCSLDGRGK
jgi:tetrahydromethanopterin S-methyltransferase subunit E